MIWRRSRKKTPGANNECGAGRKQSFWFRGISFSHHEFRITSLSLRQELGDPDGCQWCSSREKQERRNYVISGDDCVSLANFAAFGSWCESERNSDEVVLIGRFSKPIVVAHKEYMGTYFFLGCECFLCLLGNLTNFLSESEKAWETVSHSVL